MLAQLRQFGAIERFFEHILEVVEPRKIPNLPVCSEEPGRLSHGEGKRVCSEDQPAQGISTRSGVSFSGLAACSLV